MARHGKSYRSILVTSKVYEKLTSLKGKGESYSDLIERLIENAGLDYGLEKLDGVLSEGREAMLFEEAVKEASKHFR